MIAWSARLQHLFLRSGSDREEKNTTDREREKDGVGGDQHKQTNKQTEDSRRRQRCTSGFIHEGEGQPQPASFFKVNSVINHLYHTRAPYQI